MADDVSPALTERAGQAQTLRTEALEQAPASRGQVTLENEESHTFEWLMDGDARLGPVCETPSMAAISGCRSAPSMRSVFRLRPA